MIGRSLSIVGALFIFAFLGPTQARWEATKLSLAILVFSTAASACLVETSTNFPLASISCLVLLPGSFHFLQLAAERPPSEERENYRQKNKNESDKIYHPIFLFISTFLGSLSFLRIAKGLDFGGYLGGYIILLGLPLLAVSVRSFSYGFLNFTFP
jgi:hypothetical protein